MVVWQTRMKDCARIVAIANHEKKFEMRRAFLPTSLTALAAAVLVSLPHVAAADDCPSGYTPGYWKNHPQAWSAAGLGPDDSFKEVFGVTTTFNVTLMDMLRAKGGDADALGRHAVAALLNANHPEVAYPYSPDEIKVTVAATLSQYQIALFSGNDLSTEKVSIEALKDVYEALNEGE